MNAKLGILDLFSGNQISICKLILAIYLQKAPSGQRVQTELWGSVSFASLVTQRGTEISFYTVQHVATSFDALPPEK